MVDIVIDPQANGWRDDGTESGIVRAAIVGGNLVQVPFKEKNCSITNTGTASAFITSDNVNKDGSSSGISVILAADADLGSGARIVFWIVGPVFGLRYNEVSGSAACDMSVNIDGINYDVPASQTRDPISNSFYSQIPAEMQYVLVSDNLGDGQHFVEIFLPSKTTATKIFLHGFVLSSSSGVKPIEPGARMSSAQMALTTSFANCQGTDSSLAAIRKIFFQNTTAGALIVYVKRSTYAADAWSKSVAANSTEELDFGMPLYDMPLLQAKASGAGVNATFIGVQ